MSEPAPRVGIVGARRTHQGLGPFVARDLKAAGARVSCFVTTSATSLAAARRELVERSGIEARGYLDLAAMLAAEKPDALAILSPAECHADHLEAALAAGVDVLCEKPLVWGRSAAAGAAARLTRSFDARGLLLWENCQWPYTLPAFDELHPGALDQPPDRFEMTLQPASRGIQMLGDSMPHPLSLLQALTRPAEPGAPPGLEEIELDGTPEAGRLNVGFLYRSGDLAVRARVHLETKAAPSRTASFALDGRPARRLVSREGYRLSFAADGRAVSLTDPLTLLVTDFVEALRRGLHGGDRRDATRSRDITDRMALLGQLVTAFERRWGSGNPDRRGDR